MPRLPIVALVLLALAAGGCEDSVDPTVGIDAPFSLYGYLDPTADRQAIRVVPITDRLADTTATFAATVTSTDLETGATTAWRDSVVTYPGGATGHVFVADFTPRPSSRVRVVAARPDGAEAAVEVEVPPIVAAEVGLEGSRPGEITYPVRFAGAPRVLNGQLRLTAVGFPGEDASAPRTLRVPVDAVPVEVSPDVWEVTIPFLTAVRRYMVDEGLLGLGIRLVVADYVGFVTGEDWALPTTDPAALVEPGVFSNVEGGLGFVGGGYFATARWTPSAAAQGASGFAPSGDPAGGVAINEVQGGANGWVEFYNPQVNTISLSGYSVSNTESAPRLQTFPFEVSVPALGFTVVPLAFTLGPGETLALYDRASTRVARLVTAPTESTWPGGVSFGSFPDGATFQLPQGGPNIFRGALRPTPGAPNELGLAVAAVNEVFTEGAAGFVEAVALGYGAVGLQAMSDPEGFFEAVSADGAGPFRVAPETPDGLELVQVGGTVYLLATYDDPRLIPPSTDPDRHRTVRTTRVVDVRRFGGQVPGRAEGYLPDAPTGTWRAGLRPTPGAANAAARLGL